MSIRTQRFSDGIKKWHPGQYDEKRFQGWKTLTKGFAKKVMDSKITILDCDGCELTKEARKHILDNGMEVCFERCYKFIPGSTSEYKLKFTAIRLCYEAQENELI